MTDAANPGPSPAEDRFEIDGRPVDARAFRALAIDPARSVTVDACAGSGKTTLLVARMVRALLEGAAPDEILAVTFTRLAAHEMHARLVAELRVLAFADDAQLRERLTDRLCLAPAQAATLADRARGLYEAVLGHPRGPEITTFHRWFRRLAALGPLTLDGDAGDRLVEDEGPLRQRAWFDWLQSLREPGRDGLRADFESAVRSNGLSAVRGCLSSMLAQRTEWALGAGVDPQADATALRGAADRADEAYRDLWRDAAATFVGQPVDGPEAFLLALGQASRLKEPVAALVPVLAAATDAQRRQAATLAALVEAPPADADAAARWLEALAAAVLTKTGTPRALRSSKAFTVAAEPHGGESAVQQRWVALCAEVAEARALRDEGRALDTNAALLRCGADFVAAYRRLGRSLGVVDFTDLEAIAWRLLRDPAAAAYVQCRLDRRFRHLMFDEFQDTSSLQWRVVSDWLAGYAGAGERPSVFVVGDPRQSIYRFRRAEARVFDAARLLLRETFEAHHAATDTTWRNAPAVVDVLNRCLPAVMSHYRLQATRSTAGGGLFWRLPLVERSAGADADGDDGAGGDRTDDAGLDHPPDDAGSPRRPDHAEDRRVDWLTTPREDEAPARHAEGLAIADAIEAARAALAAAGHPVSYGDVFVLARARTGFAAYERALRERGIPVISDRTGGLLRTLEADDLRALLAFVRRHGDDLALAQVLASPLIGLSAAALDRLATLAAADVVPPARRRGWWVTLRALAATVPPPEVPFDAAALVARLSRWIDASRRLPVHDFLDAILAETDALAAYPAAATPAQRAVVQANLTRMLGLALDVDAGRYPSVARFLGHLRGFETLDDREGPAEGRADTVAAVRLMTIHAAKGLEADLVVLADAASRPRADGARLHVEWSPEEPAPTHVSFVGPGGAGGAGVARRALLAREAVLREREDRNLLYVALTRARLGVVVSGTRASKDGQDTWYGWLDGVDAPPSRAAGGAGRGTDARAGPPAPGDVAAPPDQIVVPDLSPLHVGARAVGPTEGIGDALAVELGQALHRALEWLADGHDEASVLAGLSAFSLDETERRAALARANSVLQVAALQPAFAPGGRAVNELDIVAADGTLGRIDRLARVGDDAWIIDYKWSVDPARRPEYLDQLAGYRARVAAARPRPLGAEGAVRTVLVDAARGTAEFDPDLR